jgi:hypothetical protein
MIAKFVGFKLPLHAFSNFSGQVQLACSYVGGKFRQFNINNLAVTSAQTLAVLSC